MNDRKAERRKKKKIRINIGRMIVVAVVIVLIGVTSFSVKRIVAFLTIASYLFASINLFSRQKKRNSSTS